MSSVVSDCCDGYKKIGRRSARPTILCVFFTFASADDARRLRELRHGARAGLGRLAVFEHAVHFFVREILFVVFRDELVRDLHSYLSGDSEALCARFDRTFGVE